MNSNHRSSDIGSTALTAADTFDGSSNDSYSVNDVETGAAVVHHHGAPSLPPSKAFGTSPSNATPGSSSNNKRKTWLIIGATALVMFFVGLSVGWVANKGGSDAVQVEVADVPSTQDVTSVSGTSNSGDADPDEEVEEEDSNQANPAFVALDGTSSPTTQPSSAPTSAPTHSPTVSPTSSPTPPPSKFNPYFFGEEFITNEELGIEMSKGLSVRLIAKTGEKVQYADGDESKSKWHPASDAAGIVPMDPNDLSKGYVYMSNSEEGDGEGGVYGLYFDQHGNILEYKPLLTGTTDNCGGGLTPWNTFVSCEEFEDGQCWQIDPVNEKAEVTVLGGKGGRYESVAVDNRNPEAPVFFTTEDDEEGELRRFVANGNGWDALHTDGETTFLVINGDGTFEWTDDEKDGMKSAQEYFPKCEGIQVHEGKVYFMSKEFQQLIILDLDNMTYETELTGKKFYGEGDFGDQPDQNLFGPSRKYIYFTEDGGTSPGVYARYGETETYFTVFQAIPGGIHSGDETVGIALSPDHKRFYAGIQGSGYIMEFTRDDGLAFE